MRRFFELINLGNQIIQESESDMRFTRKRAAKQGAIVLGTAGGAVGAYVGGSGGGGGKGALLGGTIGAGSGALVGAGLRQIGRARGMKRVHRLATKDAAKRGVPYHKQMEYADSVVKKRF